MASSYTLERLPANSTALLVVDVQPEYWSASEEVRRDFPDFEKNVAQALEMFRSRSMHVIHVRADYRKANGKSPWLWQFERIHKRAGTEKPFPEFREPLVFEEFARPCNGEVVLGKPSFCATLGTDLVDYLKAKSVDTCVVIGLITSVCVQHSAFGLFEAGFRTLVVSDACADRGRARHDAAIMLYGNYMYELIPSASDLKTLLPPNEPTEVGSGQHSDIPSSGSVDEKTSSYRLLSLD